MNISVTTPELQTITPNDSAYPIALTNCIAFKSPPTLSAIGNLSLIQKPAIALFCSIKCPGDLILKTYDLAQALRDAEIPVISGFHTPIEQDCFKILLRGIQPIIHCPARSLHTMRLSSEQKQAISENRLLLISPFKASYTRATAEMATKRNELIGAIAQIIFISYAAPNSKTLMFAQHLIKSGKSVVTMNNSDNTDLHKQNIIGLSVDEIIRAIG